ncbi:unnamed protein product, partial [marine sediment metagenome]
MNSKVETLLINYEKVLKEPWSNKLSGQEKVWFLVYDPVEQRKVALRIGDFERVTGKNNKNWVEIDLQGCFPEWMKNHEYRDAYFVDPEAIQDQIECDFQNGYQLEKLLYPAKIKDFDIPCFIIPIKRVWATQLFEEKLLEQRLQLFKDKSELMLNRQNVYYRSAQPKRLKSPARIIWYISKTKNENGYISACSYIEKIEIDLPKKLFKKYQNLGIYEWKQIYKLAKEDMSHKIMAFVF